MADDLAIQMIHDSLNELDLSIMSSAETNAKELSRIATALECIAVMMPVDEAIPSHWKMTIQKKLLKIHVLEGCPRCQAAEAE